MASLHEPPPSQSLAIRADCQGLNVDLASGELHESSSCRSPEARNQVSRTHVARDDECHAREPAHSAQTFNLARIVVLNNSHRYFYLWLTKNLWADVSKNSRYTGTTMSRKALRCTSFLERKVGRMCLSPGWGAAQAWGWVVIYACAPDHRV